MVVSVEEKAHHSNQAVSSQGKSWVVVEKCLMPTVGGILLDLETTTSYPANSLSGFLFVIVLILSSVTPAFLRAGMKSLKI